MDARAEAPLQLVLQGIPKGFCAPGLGEVLLREDRIGEATWTLRRALAAAPRYVYGWQLLASAYRAMGDAEDAAEAARRARLYGD